MAIDQNETKKFLEQIDSMFQLEVAGLPIPIPSKALKLVKQGIFGQAFDDLRRMVDQAQPSVFFLVGHSQSGKSSLINHLAESSVAKVGSGARPCSRDAISYHLTFPKRHSEFTLIDSRGIFDVPDMHAKEALVEEMSPIPPNDELVVKKNLIPGGDLNKKAEDVAVEQILQCKPDVILQVVKITDVAAMENDIKTMQRIHKATPGTPVIVVLTRADSLNPVPSWPPERDPDKMGAIAEHVASMAQYGIGQTGQKFEAIEGRDLYQGAQLSGDSPFLYVIPVNVPTDKKGNPVLDRQWNVDLLVNIIASKLPEPKQLLFLQATKRKHLLRKMSTSLISRFSTIAWGIGNIPDLGLSDIFVLTPLQVLMIAAIGGLSCRPVSKDTAGEYLAAAGLDLAGGISLRALAGFLATFYPPAKWVKAGIAAAGTYSIGKSAEAYFFAGEKRKPVEFRQEGEQFATDHKLSLS